MNTETSIKSRQRRVSLRKAQRTLSSLQRLQEEVQALKLQIARMEEVMEARQEAEAKTYHVPQSLAELKPRRQPPPGKTAMQMIQEQWPGEETTEQLLAQLKAQDGTMPNDDTHDKSNQTEAASDRPDHD